MYKMEKIMPNGFSCKVLVRDDIDYKYLDNDKAKLLVKNYMNKIFSLQLKKFKAFVIWIFFHSCLLPSCVGIL